MNYLLDYVLARTSLGFFAFLAISVIQPDNVSDIYKDVEGWVIFFSGWIAHTVRRRE